MLLNDSAEIEQRVKGNYVIKINFHSRSFSDSIHDYAGVGRNSTLSNRTGNWSKNATGLFRRVEYNSSMAWRHRDIILYRDVVCCNLLQCYHHMVYFLLYK